MRRVFCRQQKILFPIVPWRSPLFRFGGSCENRRNLTVIIATPAEIAGQRAAGLRFSRLGIFHEQRLGRHELTGSAEAALRPVMLDKGVLQRIEFVALGQAFDGQNLFAFHPDGQLAAGIQLRPDNDSAGAAFAAIAADLGAGETQVIAEDLGQGPAVLDLEAVVLPLTLRVTADCRAPLLRLPAYRPLPDRISPVPWRSQLCRWRRRRDLSEKSAGIACCLSVIFHGR